LRPFHLFDVNLLVASTVVEHVHFKAVQNWNEADTFGDEHLEVVPTA